MPDKRLIFLFSLPRSGSTLLQRILAAHPKINTCSEPWLLLPFIYTLKPYGTYAEYSHNLSYRAIQEFISTMPGKEQAYYEALRNFALSLYCQAMQPEAEYFLDKTPRYFLIISQIAKVFPNAKFIFLFRNPLHVLSSVISTWTSGKMRLESHYIDLFEGPGLLANGFKLLSDEAIKVNYEDLIAEPTRSLSKIFDYLELDFDQSILENFNEIHLKGQMGDPTGTNEYENIDNRPLEKWKSVLNTKYRKKFAVKYMSSIGNDTLQTFGYDLNELIREVERIANGKGWGLKDRYNLFIGLLFRIFEVPLFRLKRRERLAVGKKFLLHR